MYQYSIVNNVDRVKQTFVFNTYEELLEHFVSMEPYTQGSDAYYSVIGIISRNACKI